MHRFLYEQHVLHLMKIFTHRKLQILGATIIIGGIAVMTPFALIWHQNRTALAKSGPAISVPAVAPLPAPKPALITGKPVRLEIPSLGFNLEVADGVYNPKTATWSLSRDKAHYALPSTQPNNEEGNTLIYGHYRKEVFARLHLIKEGAQVFVTTDNGYRFTYTFQKTEAYDPADTSIFAYTGAPQLTIQTCSGAYMQNRQMFHFTFDGVQKI